MEKKTKINSIFLVLTLIFLLTGCVVGPITRDVERAKAEGIPLVILNIDPSLPNYVGGVDVSAYFVNTSGQTLRHVHITLMPYNKDGEAVPTEIGGRESPILRSAGPIEPDMERHASWKNVWHHHAIRCIEVTRVEIAYLNGKSERFSGAKVKKILDSSIKKTCEAQSQ